MARSYTEKQLSTIRDLWPTHTAAEIARRLGDGLTRNAIIGKAHRMKLPAKADRGHPRYRARSPLSR